MQLEIFNKALFSPGVLSPDRAGRSCVRNTIVKSNHLPCRIGIRPIEKGSRRTLIHNKLGETDEETKFFDYFVGCAFCGGRSFGIAVPRYS
jgi:hypothetical protein